MNGRSALMARLAGQADGGSLSSNRLIITDPPMNVTNRQTADARAASQLPLMVGRGRNARGAAKTLAA